MSVTKLKKALVYGAMAAVLFMGGGCGDSDDGKKNSTGPADDVTKPITQDVKNNPFNCEDYENLTQTPCPAEQFVLNIKLPDNYDTASATPVTVRFGENGSNITIPRNNVFKHTDGKYYALITHGDDSDTFTLVDYPEKIVLGGTLILGTNEAWVLAYHGDTTGFIFKTNNVCLFVFKESGVWFADTGSYTSTAGGTLIVTDSDGYKDTVNYSVSGSKLTLIDPQGVEPNTVYTKTGGVVIGGGSTGPVAGTGGDVVLGTNQAWTITDNQGNGVGYIFKSNNQCVIISKDNGAWQEVVTLPYTTGGGFLVIAGIDSIGYSVSSNGNTLTLIDPFGEGDVVYTKTSNVTISGPQPGTGGNVVLGPDEAWTMLEEFYGDSIGYIFKANGEFLSITKWGSTWEEDFSGTYQAQSNNGILSVNVMGMSYTWGYSVANNTLTIINPWGDGDEVYKKSSGVVIGGTTEPTGGDVVLGADWAWTIGHYGYIFKANGEFAQLTNWDGPWEEDFTGTYSIDGAYITLDYGYGDEDTFGYSVSGNGNTLTIIDPWGYGYNEVYTKTDITIVVGYDPRLWSRQGISDLMWVLSTDEDVILDFDGQGSLSQGEYFLGSAWAAEWYTIDNTVFLIGNNPNTWAEVIVELQYSFDSQDRLLLTRGGATTTWLPRDWSSLFPSQQPVAKSNQPSGKLGKAKSERPLSMSKSSRPLSKTAQLSKAGKSGKGNRLLNKASKISRKLVK